MSERKRSLSGGSVSDDQLDLWWGEFLEEGDELFDHMTKNFNTMFSDAHINHFHLIYGTTFAPDEIEDISEKYGNDIQAVLFLG